MQAEKNYVFKLWKNYNQLKSSKQCIIVLRERSGRLGNRLFMFASAYGLSLNRSCQLYIASDIIKELNQSFDINPPNLLLTSSVNSTNSFKKIYNHCSFYSDLYYSNYSYSIELSGFWQVYRYFIDYQEEVKQHLRFKQSILDRANQFFNKAINRNISTVIGIHIRRSDFLLVRRVSSDNYILNAMSYFETKYGLVTFVIVSDDKSYCQKSFGHKSNVLITPNTFQAIDDLAILTLCDHLILTVGTFGWWGGFLLRNKIGEVITDSKPDHSPIDVNCRREDYFPPRFSFLNKTIS
ncbi:unnamed protein product [Adineta ricciae]|uniref:L-Fucosyltransferase n=1 Tax=Adineta ricciae TaxID=249248 RepID=A0A814NTI3_ADIRI|nr:unnamed protein product [Adineta ricciae]